ncbi:hypothetical protein [Halomonas maura]|uniref:hypothetical protein n=1 Tax=Halomonas maura TaxID=117606 RepID=UPI0025B597EC|nr:hypothetical protein [Halomonas maura]MDN3555578.1 hypothetical protein [Halomonas maura]
MDMPQRVLLALMLALLAPAALAQDPVDDPHDVDVVVIDDAEEPDDDPVDAVDLDDPDVIVVEESEPSITLEGVRESAPEAATFGLGTAQQAVENGGVDGAAVSDSASDGRRDEARTAAETGDSLGDSDVGGPGTGGRDAGAGGGGNGGGPGGGNGGPGGNGGGPGRD